MTINDRIVAMLRARYVGNPAIVHASDSHLLRAYTLWRSAVHATDGVSQDTFPNYVCMTAPERNAAWNAIRGTIAL